LIRKWPNFRAANMNRPDRSTFAEQWGRQDSANLTGLPAFGKFALGLRSRYVMDVNRLSVDHSPADKSTAGHWSSFLSSESVPIHAERRAKTYHRQYAKLPRRLHRKAALHFLRPPPAPAEYPSAS